MRSLGIDVGGANTKVILLENGQTRDHWLKYIPLWKNDEKLKLFLKQIAKSKKPDRVGVTMTGEICDAFRTKREGVLKIIETVCGAFGDDICYFISLDGELLSRSRSISTPEKLMAANWVASTLILGEKYPDCLFIDAGSTTVDIIPVKNGKPGTRGRTDFQRLKTGELVYTGVLRTPLPCVCSEIQLNGEKIQVATENFANMADVYRVIGMLKQADYTCETPDGRGKDKKSCLRRIARTFCCDLEELGVNLALKAAWAFQREQTEQVTLALRKVTKNHELPEKIKVILAGIGRLSLARMVARKSGFKKMIDLAKVYDYQGASMTPAFGAGLLAGEAGQLGRSS